MPKPSSPRDPRSPPKHLELGSRKSGQHRRRTNHAGWDIIAGRDDPHARRRTHARSPQAGAHHQAATSSGCTCNSKARPAVYSRCMRISAAQPLPLGQDSPAAADQAHWPGRSLLTVPRHMRSLTRGSHCALTASDHAVGAQRIEPCARDRHQFVHALLHTRGTLSVHACARLATESHRGGCACVWSRACATEGTTNVSVAMCRTMSRTDFPESCRNKAISAHGPSACPQRRRET